MGPGGLAQQGGAATAEPLVPAPGPGQLLESPGTRSGTRQAAAGGNWQ